MLLLTCAPKASEIVNTDRTIRTEDNRIPKHFLSKETFMTHRDTHEHENNKVFSYQRFMDSFCYPVPFLVSPVQFGFGTMFFCNYGIINSYNKTLFFLLLLR